MKRFFLFVSGLICGILFVTAAGASAEEKGAVIAEGQMESNAVAADEDISGDFSAGEWGVPKTARAFIRGTDPDSAVSGTADFVETGDGVQVVVSISNVTPAGKHGFHIHESGSCEDGGKAAGGHFNPAGTSHGFLPRDGHGKAHAGDLGNIEVNDEGRGTIVLFLPGLSLTEGHRNIAGRAVILHAKEDDFSQPAGNAGERIGCGEIILNK